MTIEFKIADLNSSPNLAFGWATSVISIVDEESNMHLVFPDTIKHLTIELDNIDDTSDSRQSNIILDKLHTFFEFIDQIGEYEKVLIHSRMGHARAPTLYYLYLMYIGQSPASAICAVKSLVDDFKLNCNLIHIFEKKLNIGERHSHFISIWENSCKKSQKEIDENNNDATITE